MVLIMKTGKLKSQLKSKIMRILIIEDEPPIALEIMEFCHHILQNQISSIEMKFSLDEAFTYLKGNKIDICLLDLNLSGKDGFTILQEFTGASFQTIVISAYINKAINAFEYGVLDFVPKPVDKNRLKAAFDRYLENQRPEKDLLRFLTIRKKNRNYLVDISEIIYLKADGYLIEVHCIDGSIELIEKPLNNLEQILPSFFIRSHRSYIVNVNFIQSYYHQKGGVYKVLLKNEETISLSPAVYQKLKSRRFEY